MTASPAAVPSSPPKMADNGNALAALFAAAAANSMHRQISSPTTSSSMTSNIKNCNQVNAAAAALCASMASPSSSSSSSSSRKQTNQGTSTIDKESGNNSAAQFFARLLNGEPKQQSASTPIKFSINGGTNSGTNSCRYQQQQQQQKQQQTPITSQLTPKATKSPATKKVVAPIMAATIVSPTKMPAQQQQQHKTTNSTKVTCETEPNNSVELRNLQTWHDESEGLLDESCYQELVDLGNTNGWSADEMFKYNEKRHKITSSYDEETLGSKYTTPLSQNKSRTTVRMASKLAKEIEDKVQLEGRITPESSDDDEMFEIERNRRNLLKHQKQLDQLRSLKAINSLSIHSQNGRSKNNNKNNNYHNQIDMSASSGSSDGGSISTTNGFIKTNNRRLLTDQHHNHVASGSSRRTSNKSSSQHSNSSTTPVTASLSSSPTLNDSIGHQNVIKMTSSSRNILRTCLI